MISLLKELPNIPIPIPTLPSHFFTALPLIHLCSTSSRQFPILSSLLKITEIVDIKAPRSPLRKANNIHKRLSSACCTFRCYTLFSFRNIFLFQPFTSYRHLEIHFASGTPPPSPFPKGKGKGPKKTFQPTRKIPNSIPEPTFQSLN